MKEGWLVAWVYISVFQLFFKQIIEFSQYRTILKAINGGRRNMMNLAKCIPYTLIIIISNLSNLKNNSKERKSSKFSCHSSTRKSNFPVVESSRVVLVTIKSFEIALGKHWRQSFPSCVQL